MSFAYNASAVALGGSIVLPSPAIIQSQASTALAPTGGVGREAIGAFNYDGMIKFKGASVYVTGSRKGDIFNTLTTVSIEGLDVQGILTADLIVGRIVSSHEKGQAEGVITFDGTSVDNLRIAGKRIDPRFNYSFFDRYPTHKAMLDGLKEPVAGSGRPDVQSWVQEEVSKARDKAIAQGAAFDETAFRTELESRDVAGLVANRFCWQHPKIEYGSTHGQSSIHCSLADDIPGIEEMTVEEEAKLSKENLSQFHRIRRSGYVVKVEGFGTIKLAEIIIKPGEKRLNMFRLELGSPITGDLTVGSVSTNGTELVP